MEIIAEKNDKAVNNSFKNMELKEIVLYDFVDNTASNTKDTALERYIQYIENTKKKDPDIYSEKLQEIYNCVWRDDIIENDYMKRLKPNGWIYSDTMTSVTGRIIEYFKDFEENITIGESTIQQRRLEEGKNQHMSSKLIITWYNKYKTEIERVMEPFRPLLYVYHTIGNYCPVSIGFNRSRSGFSKYDFWDLSLEKIYEYYMTDGKPFIIIGSELLHNTGNSLACKEWLDSFGEKEEGWEKFVKYNYFQDYVDDNFKPRPFVDGHNWQNIKIEDTKWKNFIKVATDRILSRGMRIACKIKGENYENNENQLEDIKCSIMSHKHDLPQKPD